MIILNEKAYVEEHFLKNKEIGDKPYDTLMLLARYYYHISGYKKNEIETLLNDYMIKNYYDRYMAKKSSWENTIEEILKRAKKYPLHEIDCVWITKSEMKKIQAINNRDMERVAFAYLCLAKLHNLQNPKNNGWVNDDMKDVFNMARVKRSNYDKAFLLHDLMLLGLLEFPKQTGNLSSRVTFVDDDSKNVMAISDFRELGYEYLRYYSPDSYARCAECGILFKKPKDAIRRYCKNCSNTSSETQKKMKKIFCVDCGKGFEVKMSSRTIRCDECKEKERRRINTEAVRKWREKKKEEAKE